MQQDSREAKDGDAVRSTTLHGSDMDWSKSRCESLVVTIVVLLAMLQPTSRSHAQESTWPVQQKLGPFHFHSDRSLQDYPRLTEDMMQLRQELSNKLGLECAVDKVHVVLLRSESEYQRYIQHYFPQLPARRALFVKDRGPGIVFAFRHEEFLIDLRHECTHALLQCDVPNIPLWLDEGLAEYFETLGTPGRYHATHAPAAQWQARLGHVPSLEELEDSLSPQQMDARRYSDAWAWVHFLLERDDQSRHLLQGYLNDLRYHGLSAGNLSTRVRRNLPDWRGEFLKHYQGMQAPEPQSAKVPVVQASATTREVR